MRVRILSAAVVLLLCTVLFELACQVYARAVVFRRFDEVMARPNHYYQPSASPVLAYELRPGVEMVREGRLLRIGRHGIRALDDDLASEKWRLAVLGDSVVFGVGHTETQTISGHLQRELDPDGDEIRVFNFGLPGLNLPEVADFLRLKDAVYDVDEVVYLLNANDFSLRESRFEGADNGLYRMYKRPKWMGLWFVRKGIYRLNKPTASSSEWYKWMFGGGEKTGYEALSRMSAYSKDHDIAFSVVLLPSGAAFQNGEYLLTEMFERVGQFLSSAGIRYIDATEDYRKESDGEYDATDHFNDSGNVKMAQLMARFLRANPSIERTAHR
jgi:hypothetical protein